ncbi:MAG: ddl [Phycisphaerales bacterium]|nr:ddl [Phycisphaerales bacterium]
MKVTVLRGGPSAEREVSLVSGAAVAAGLREAGHDVFESDVSPTDLAGLDAAADVIFPVLHGAFGESGELQEILEARGLPFVGSGSKSSKVGIDKVATKKVWEAAGLPTPPYAVLRKGDPVPAMADGPCVVKAVGSGSSIDVFICKDPKTAAADARAAIAKVFASHEVCLVEKFVTGPELTVGLLEEKALAPIRIVPASGVFDFEAKYKRNDTEHRFDTGLPPETIKQCQDLCERANAVLGCMDLARIDVMLDEGAGLTPYLLEINTLPGFTPKSLLPEAAAHGGVPFPKLVDRLARRAAERGPRKA